MLRGQAEWRGGEWRRGGGGREHVINQSIVRLLSTCAEKPDSNARKKTPKTNSQMRTC